MNIKKNTTLVFKDKQNQKTEKLIGGLPLSKGDIVYVHEKKSAQAVAYKVTEKKIDCFRQEQDLIANITYVLNPC